MNLTLSKSAAAVLAGLVLAVSGGTTWAAPFSSGSNGSYGPINITANTVLDMPPDGIFHCTTITVAPNATLSFKRNPLNTPVYLLATSNVLISGSISVSGSRPSGAVPGAGGPGGFDGGYGGFGSTAPGNIGGDGQGPGRGINASQKGNAAYGASVSQNTNVYGNVLIVPMIGGSGGSGANGNPGGGGGGGGGAILIASDTSIIVNGGVYAVGGYGNGSGGSGSGGAIRLVAPTGGGNGNIQAHSDFNQASSGRVRIDTENNQGFRNLTYFGYVTRGNRMFVFPPSTPKLHIIEAAGQVIPVGTGSVVSIELPPGSPTAQTVKIRGEGFTGTVPIQLLVTPEHTASTVFELNLDASANPAEVSASITIPTAQLTRIQAWSR